MPKFLREFLTVAAIVFGVVFVGALLGSFVFGAPKMRFIFSPNGLFIFSMISIGVALGFTMGPSETGQRKPAESPQPQPAATTAMAEAAAADQHKNYTGDKTAEKSRQLKNVTVDRAPITQEQKEKRDKILQEVSALAPDTLMSNKHNEYADIEAFIHTGARDKLEWLFDHFPMEMIEAYSDVVLKFEALADDQRRRYSQQELGNVALYLERNTIFLSAFELSVMGRSPLLEKYAEASLSAEEKGPDVDWTDDENLGSEIFTQYTMVHSEFVEAMQQTDALLLEQVIPMIEHAEIGRVPMDGALEGMILRAVDQTGLGDQFTAQREEMKTYFAKIVKAHPAIDTSLGGFSLFYK